MAIIKQKYSQDKVDMLYDHLKTYADRGDPIDFEIKVDGFSAIRRTNDPELFSSFESYVTPQTSHVEILIFKGGSRNCDKYQYSLGTGSSDSNSLNGVDDIKSHVQAELDKARKEWRYELLEQENKELKEELEELENENNQLQVQMAEMQAKQSPLNGILGEVGSSFVESFVRRNPKMLTALPGGEALAGLMDDDKPKSIESTAPDAEVTFKPKSSGLSEDEQAAITFVNQLKHQFKKEEFDEIIQILEIFARDKSKITICNQLLKESNNE